MAPADTNLTRAVLLLAILVLSGCANGVPRGPVAVMPDRSTGGGNGGGSGGGGMM